MYKVILILDMFFLKYEGGQIDPLLFVSLFASIVRSVSKVFPFPLLPILQIMHMHICDALAPMEEYCFY